jgi:hypothetical protein
MFPTEVGGQPAAVAYRRDGHDGTYRAFGVILLTGGGSQLTGIDVFVDPRLVALFGFPATAGVFPGSADAGGPAIPSGGARRHNRVEAACRARPS